MLSGLLILITRKFVGRNSRNKPLTKGERQELERFHCVKGVDGLNHDADFCRESFTESGFILLRSHTEMLCYFEKFRQNEEDSTVFDCLEVEPVY
jgi:hypothetical protein